MADFITRPPFDENGYPEGYEAKTEKKRSKLPWIIGGVLVVLILGFVVKKVLMVSPAKRGAEAIVTAYRQCLGDEKILVRDLGLSDTMEALREEMHKTTFSLAFKGTDWELGSNVPFFLRGLDLNLLAGLGIKLSSERGFDSVLYGVDVSYGAVNVGLLDFYMNEDEMVAASPNFIKSTFRLERVHSDEPVDWQNLKMWELLPEPYRSYGKEGVGALINEKESWQRRFARARRLIPRLYKDDVDKLLKLLLNFDYEKSGKPSAHYMIEGKKQAVTEYTATASCKAFGDVLGYLFDVEDSLITVSGKDKEDKVYLRLLLTGRDVLVSLSTDFTVSLGSIDIPVKVELDFNGEEQGGDAFTARITVTKPKLLTKKIQQLFGTTLEEILAPLGEEALAKMDGVLGAYGDMTIGEMLSETGIMTEQEVLMMISGIESDELVTTITKNCVQDGKKIVGEWSFDVSTDTLNLGTFRWEYEFTKKGKFNFKIDFLRNNSRYFTIDGEGNLSTDEKESMALNFTRITITEAHSVTFKFAFRKEIMEEEPARPVGDKEFDLSHLDETSMEDVKEEAERGAGLIKSFMELMGF